MVVYNIINGIAGAFFNTLITVSAFFFVFMDFKKAYVLKDPGDKACRTEKVAKWSIVE